MRSIKCDRVGLLLRDLRILNPVSMESAPVVLPARGIHRTHFDSGYGRNIRRGARFEFVHPVLITDVMVCAFNEGEQRFASGGRPRICEWRRVL